MIVDRGLGWVDHKFSILDSYFNERSLPKRLSLLTSFRGYEHRESVVSKRPKRKRNMVPDSVVRDTILDLVSSGSKIEDVSVKTGCSTARILKIRASHYYGIRVGSKVVFKSDWISGDCVICKGEVRNVTKKRVHKSRRNSYLISVSCDDGGDCVSDVESECVSLIE